MTLYEKYRPISLDTFLGQPKATAVARRLMASAPEGTESVVIAGPSGTGKTTLARIISHAWALDAPLIELDGDACTVEVIREIRETLRYTPLRGLAYIINEYHAMTPKAVQASLTLLEAMPRRCVILFTTTEEPSDMFGNFAGPFESRCKVIRFTNQALSDTMAARALEIARLEGMDGRPLSQYKRLVQDCHNNFRMVLQKIDAGEMLAES